MSKYTPGPWEVRKMVATDTYAIVTPSNSTTHDCDEQGRFHIARTRDEANARLIAAAPEMLEALKQVVTDCKCSVKERLSGHLTDCSVPAALEVIARAEGRSDE